MMVKFNNVAAQWDVIKEECLPKIEKFLIYKESWLAFFKMFVWLNSFGGNIYSIKNRVDFFCLFDGAGCYFLVGEISITHTQSQCHSIQTSVLCKCKPYWP